MPTKSIVLTQRHASLIQKSVDDGEFRDASEVISAAMRLLEMQRKESQLKLKKLRQLIQVGLDEIERGEYTELHGETEIDQFVAEIAEKARKRVAR